MTLSTGDGVRVGDGVFITTVLAVALTTVSFFARVTTAWELDIVDTPVA